MCIRDSVDDKTDVYALGCVLFQALAGRPPFQAEGAGELIGMHLFQPPPLLSELAPKLPAAVVELVHRMLIKDKSLRPDMATTAHQLGRLLAQVTGSASALASQTQWRAESSTGSELARSAQATTISMSAGQSTASQRKRRSILIAGAVALVLMTVSLLSLIHISGHICSDSPSNQAGAGATVERFRWDTDRPPQHFDSRGGSTEAHRVLSIRRGTSGESGSSQGENRR